jgi:hypothetical protein
MSKKVGSDQEDESQISVVDTKNPRGITISCELVNLLPQQILGDFENNPPILSDESDVCIPQRHRNALRGNEL